MGSLAAIEIKPLATGALPVKLIEDAYRASRRGRIVLMLNGVEPERVDDIVDPLVRSMRLTIPGLRYVDADDGASVLAAMRQSCSIFASRTGKLARFRKNAVHIHALAEASVLLGRLCRPTRIGEIRPA